MFNIRQLCDVIIKRRSFSRVLDVLGVFFFASYILVTIFGNHLAEVINGCGYNGDFPSIACKYKLFDFDFLGAYLTVFSLYYAPSFYFLSAYTIFHFLIPFELGAVLWGITWSLFGIFTILMCFRLFYKLFKLCLPELYEER